ncbi:MULTISPECIES: anti-sigma factor family protein [Dietzia]|uniref:Zf-HC2 domain-containing protein n=2 Tax=Dietzia TaxID=37914 RepID=A0AAE4U4I9_9ACTN|nr:MULTISPECIES: zf-HC2 domain-containing protein [Dietzia]MVZ89169.1 hypothetical protein [Microbacter sp. ANSKLAB05]ODQ94752.1 hypothetical protein BFG51_13895 [Dietzia alimentaria]MBB1013313.1 hypothetical protein [Dietzia kunjamensis]MBB1014447.1 hypothetical protein [Dietzia kunjamensis subsp. schimae]MDV6297974.1 zf-HC2 domain-containing protein [Dietzia maris]
MDRHLHERGPGPEFTLSFDSARKVVDRTGPPRARESFLSTDHLSTEAAAAYVDGRLPPSGQSRADAHLARCPHCRREVEVQREARRALRGSGPIQMPRELLERLRSLEDAPDPATRTGPDPVAGSEETHGWSRLLRRLWRRGN